ADGSHIDDHCCDQTACLLINDKSLQRFDRRWIYIYCLSINEAMRVNSNLDRVMAERQVSLTELAHAIGITLANLSILKTNKAKAVRFSTLAKLCQELGCQPGDLLEFEENDESRPKRATFSRKAATIRRPDSGLPGDYY